MDRARHVVGWHFTQSTRAHEALDDVASTIHESLEEGTPDPPSCMLQDHGSSG